MKIIHFLSSVWHSIGKEIDPNLECDIAKFADQLFDEIPSLNDTWLSGVMVFNNECLKHIDDKKIIEMLIDMLILRNIYYQLQKPY